MGHRLEVAEQTKWEVYEQVLRVPYYVVLDRYVNRLRVFVLKAGPYQKMTLEQDKSSEQPFSEQPRFWMAELKLGLGMWEGEYQGITRRWLRWYGEDGEWIPTQAEQIDKQAEQLDMAQAQADRAQQELARLQEKLKAAGINPGQL